MKEMVRFGGGIVGHEKWRGSMFWGKEKGREERGWGEIVFCIDFQSWVLGEGECREERGLGFVIVHFEFLIFRVEC